jgi:integrase
MSVYRKKDKNGKRQVYSYKFQINGYLFHGSTGCTERTAALRVEKQKRAEEERKNAKHAENSASFRGECPLTLDAAAGRWFLEVGSKNTASETQWTNLTQIIQYFGADIHLNQITDEMVAAWVQKRSLQTRWGDAAEKLISHSTVNRTTVDMLRKIFNRARRVWKIQLQSEPDWTRLRLAETGKKVNLLHNKAEEALHEHIPDGYRDIWRFALASGLRLAECFLTWGQITWPSIDANGNTVHGYIEVIQKGNRPHIIPLSREMIAIITPQKGHDDLHVFTAPLRRRKNGGQKIGARFAITYAGMKTAWRRAKEKAGVSIRFHDMRHTKANRVLNQTGDITMVQQLLGHSRLSTTADYYMHLSLNRLLQGLNGEITQSDDLDNCNQKRNQPTTKRKNAK